MKRFFVQTVCPILFACAVFCVVVFGDLDNGTGELREITFGNIKKVSYHFISDVTEAAQATTTEYYSGRIMAVAYVPGTATKGHFTVTEAGNYSTGQDLLCGTFGALGSTVQEVTSPLGYVVSDRLIISASSVGVIQDGTITLIIW